MPAKKYDIKGEKHFPNISDETLEEYADMIQTLLYNYPKRDNPEMYQTLSNCLQDIKIELVDRAGCNDSTSFTPLKTKVKKPKLLGKKTI